MVGTDVRSAWDAVLGSQQHAGQPRAGGSSQSSESSPLTSKIVLYNESLCHKNPHKPTFPVALAQVRLTHKSPWADGASCRGRFQEHPRVLWQMPSLCRARMGWARGWALPSFVLPLNPIYFLEVEVMKLR